jgi:hypothetical protein
MSAPPGLRGDWSWGYNAETRKVAFRALAHGLPVIFAEGPVIDSPEALRAWVHTLVQKLREHGLAETGFPAAELIESARHTFEQVHGLTWGTGS